VMKPKVEEEVTSDISVVSPASVKEEESQSSGEDEEEESVSMSPDRDDGR